MAFRILGYIPEILPRLKPAQLLHFLNQAALAALLLCQNRVPDCLFQLTLAPVASLP